jgi:tripartite-type tricarboxylate transporter receptor subunit TctC
MAGRLQAASVGAPALLPFIKAGKLRCIATGTSVRLPQLPDVPTVAEQGYPGFRTVTWNGYLAPAATPRQIIERVAREIAAGCKDAAFVERLNKIGVDAVCSSPRQFSQAIKEDLGIWKEAVQAAGMK